MPEETKSNTSISLTSKSFHIKNVVIAVSVSVVILGLIGIGYWYLLGQRITDKKGTPITTLKPKSATESAILVGIEKGMLEKSATQSALPVSVDSETKKYTNSTFNFTLNYPKGWTVYYYDVFNQKNHELRFTTGSINDVAASLLISEDTTYQSLVNSLKGVPKATEVGIFTVSGNNGVKLFSNNGGSFYYYLWTSSGVTYFLHGSSFVQSQMDNIVSSFKFKGEDPKPSTPPTVVETPVVTIKTYTNSTYKFSFDYPANWAEFDFNVFNDKNLLVQLNYPQTSVSLNVSADTSYQTFYDSFTKGLNRYIEVGKITVGNVSGVKLYSNGNPSSPDYYYLWTKNNISYYLSGASTFDKNMSDIIASFKFTP